MINFAVNTWNVGKPDSDIKIHKVSVGKINFITSKRHFITFSMVKMYKKWTKSRKWQNAEGISKVDFAVVSHVKYKYRFYMEVS